MRNTVIYVNDEICHWEESAVNWMIGQKANESGLQKLSRDYLRAVACEDARQYVSKQYGCLNQSAKCSITIDQFEDSL